jgi:hypothetical protein
VKDIARTITSGQDADPTPLPAAATRDAAMPAISAVFMHMRGCGRSSGARARARPPTDAT